MSNIWTLTEAQLGQRSTLSSSLQKDTERREEKRKAVKGYDRETISKSNSVPWVR